MGVAFLAKFAALIVSIRRFKFDMRMNLKRLAMVAASAAVVTLGSCTRHEGEPVSRDILYNGSSRVDSEGFEFLKAVHEKAVFETALAKYVQGTSASAEAKALAGQVIAAYEPLIAELESLGTDVYVLLPDPGTPAFTMPNHLAADSLGNMDSHRYIHHVQHELAAVIAQLSRAERNTHQALRAYAKEKLPAIRELYAAAGGTEDHHAHH